MKYEMDIRVLRICGIVFVLSYCAWFFLPYTYGYMQQETQSLLSYGGHGAILQNEGVNDFIGWFFLLGTCIAAFGTILCKKLFRAAYTILIVCSVLMGPLWGMGVETAGGVFLGYISNLAAGMLLATAYLSKASNEFY